MLLKTRFGGEFSYFSDQKGGEHGPMNPPKYAPEKMKRIIKKLKKEDVFVLSQQIFYGFRDTFYKQFWAAKYKINAKLQYWYRASTNHLKEKFLCSLWLTSFWHPRSTGC